LLVLPTLYVWFEQGNGKKERERSSG